LVEFAFNNIMPSSTKQIPFFSNYGHHPQADPFQIKDEGSPNAEDLTAHLAAIHDELAFQLYEAQDRYKDYADRQFSHWRSSVAFTTEYTNKRPLRKLEYQRLGPFQIIA
jgi:hypothetical protein